MIVDFVECLKIIFISEIIFLHCESESELKNHNRIN